jgi:hypothetical protein
MSNGRHILSIARQARDAWQHAAPRRAMGAIHALRGFDYQFCVFLKTLILQWRDTPPEKRTAGPDAVTEVVSDILTALPGGPIYVTQVKLSLSRSSFASALVEFAEINKAVAPVAPDLRFGICSPVKPDWDIAKEAAHWAKSRGFSELDAHSFARRIDILTESDPFDDCLGVLANDLADRRPVDHLREMLGLLLHGSYAGDLLPLSPDIWQRLNEIEKAKVAGPPGIYVWTPADRPPAAVTGGETLIGQQPMAHHLREGYFAVRETLYGSMMRAVTDWLQDGTYRSDPCRRLPVFWIGGRSGSGKSVALLHVLAAAHAQGADHVMWLQDNPSLLPDALAWAAGLAKQGRQAVIGIDDPYSPNKRSEDPALWSQALANFTGIRETGSSDPLPAIICCGPTEHAERFESDFISSVALEREDIPSAERSAELAELRAWYVKRKGQPPPSLGDEDVLLVQLFFQWQTGLPLHEFSLRFKKRLEEAGGDKLREVISCMLCANRLYVGYPDAAVTERLMPEQLDVLDRLLKEHHVARMTEGRTGFWLTHPHLANVIYESWHRADRSAATRREHLARVIVDSLRCGRTPPEKTAPLWAVSRAVKDDPDDPAAGRLDDATLVEVIPRVYGTRNTAGQGIALSELPAWIQLRASFAQLAWQPDPFDLAITGVAPRNINETGLRLTCHKVLESLDAMTATQRRQACAAIYGLLERCQDWFEWHHVAFDASRTAPHPTLDALITAWIRRHPHKTQAHYLLLDLLRAERISAEIADLAAEVLASPHGRPRVLADIAETLSQSMPTERSAAAVRDWAAAHCRERHAGYLLAQLVRKGEASARQWAHDWAAAWRTDPSANWVLEALCEAGSRDPMLRDQCLAWIQSGHAEANPGYLLEKVLRAFGCDPAVERAAFDWLEKTPATDGTWLFVFVALMAGTHDRRRLTSLGMDAIAMAWPGRRLWRPVWTAMWDATHGSSRVLNAGVAALQRLPYHKEAWVETWNLLWHKTGGAPGLAEVAADWLDTCVKSRAWGGMWGRLWRLGQPSRPRLKAIAQKWLGRNLRTWNVWFAIWQNVWETDRSDATTHDLVRKWLHHTPFDLPAWIAAWEIAWHRSKGDSDLVELATRWLDETPHEHGAWPKIWLFLWEKDKTDAALRERGRTWMKTAPLDEGSWPVMWRALWSFDKPASTLQTAALSWVKLPQSFKHGDWYNIWNEALGFANDKAGLIALGRQWLRQTYLENNTWVSVLTRLHKAMPEDPELLRLACQWLERTKIRANQWPNLWRDVRKARLDTPALNKRVREFLTTDFDYDAWFHLWDSLRDTAKIAAKPDDPFTALALKWLRDMTKKKPSHGSWALVWTALWEDETQHQELESIAMKWLERVPVTQTTWPPVWNILREAKPGDAAIQDIGRRLLRRMPNHHLSWHHVWRPLLDASQTDPELINMGGEWLRTAPIQQVNWSDAWLRLYVLGHGDPDMMERALSWLELTSKGQNLRGWQDVWSVLWDAKHAQDRLARAARQWRSVAPKSTDVSITGCRLGLCD